jgi:hypothetical protein
VSLTRQQVASYTLSFDAGLGAPGRLRLNGGDGAQIAEFGFVAAQTTPPPPRISSTGLAAGFLRMDALPPLLELLEHGTPVFLEIDDDLPGYVSICSDTRVIARQPESP